MPLFAAFRLRLGRPSRRQADPRKLQPSRVPVQSVSHGLAVVYRSDDNNELVATSLALFGDANGELLWSLTELASLHAELSDVPDVPLASTAVFHLASTDDAWSSSLFTVLAGHVVTCINSASGAVRWRFDLGFSQLSPLSVSDSRLFVFSTLDVAFCLDTASGSLLWSRALWLGGLARPTVVLPSPRDAPLYIAATSSRAALVCFFDDMRILCAHASTGVTHWERVFLSPSTVVPCARTSLSALVLVEDVHNLRGITISTGEAVWTSALDAAAVLCVHWRETVLVLALSPASLSAFDVGTGARLTQSLLPEVEPLLTTSSNTKFPLVHTVSASGIVFAVLGECVLAINSTGNSLMYVECVAGMGDVYSAELGARGQLFLRTEVNVLSLQSL